MQPLEPKKILISARLPTVETSMSLGLGCPLRNQEEYVSAETNLVQFA